MRKIFIPIFFVIALGLFAYFKTVEKRIIEIGTSAVKIQMPQNFEAYSTAIDQYLAHGGEDPLLNWPFITSKINLKAPTRDAIKASAEEVIKAINNNSTTLPAINIMDLVVTNETAHITLATRDKEISITSSTLAKIYPIIERTLLQFPDIKKVILREPLDKNDL